MLDAVTILSVLERVSQAVRSHHLEPQWAEFSHRVGNLAEQFKAIADKEDPEIASSELEMKVNDLLEICWDYPYVTDLLDQVGGVSLEPELGSDGIMRPPPPTAEPKFSPKEVANCYYSLLIQLKKTAG